MGAYGRSVGPGERGCVKDGVDIPMTDVCCDTKSAQMEQRSTFLGLDNNRLVRWDMRMAGGVAQAGPIVYSIHTHTCVFAARPKAQ